MYMIQKNVVTCGFENLRRYVLPFVSSIYHPNVLKYSSRSGKESYLEKSKTPQKKQKKKQNWKTEIGEIWLWF